jgi:aryl-alcohol dehydrogenase-like predicted oxidoreductase
VGLQIRYSLIDRTAEADLLPMARAYDMAVTPWSVLGAGVLTGKYHRDVPPEQGRAKAGAATKERNMMIGAEVVSIAHELGCSPAQVALAWVKQQAGTVIPLVGARNEKQLKDNLGALEVRLGHGHLARLDEASAIDLGFPHNFLSADHIRKNVYGGTFDNTEVPKARI